MRRLLIVLLAVVSIAAHADDNRTFLDAREAYRNGHAERLAADAEALHNSLLAPYLEYWQLSLQLPSTTDAKIRDFIARNADTPLSHRLRTDWMQFLGQHQDWNTYLAHYAELDHPDTALQCYAWQAQDALSTAPLPPSAEAQHLWRAGKPLPAPCIDYFNRLFANQNLNEADAWQRARAALTEDDTSTAQAAFAWLAIRPFDVRQMNLASSDPTGFLDATHDLQQRGEQELVRYAIIHLARHDAQAAAAQWLRWQTAFAEPARKDVWGKIALYASRQHLPEALDWFAQSDGNPLDDDTLAWKTRAALLAGNWNMVRQSILAMSDAGRADPAWRYWLARSDSMLGDARAANLLLLPLSREFNFYGLLAGDDLGAVASAPTINVSVSSDELDAMRQLPGIQRALLLYRLDLRTDAYAEWRWASRDFNDRQLLAAAELARQQRWLDCAINTADRTRELHNFALRFLTPYHDLAHSYAEQYDLNEAWVYGLIRQESRFVSQAHSGAGAAGLMQIMPTTARWIARKLGIHHFHQDRLGEPDTSLKFGMYYLKTIQQRLGNSDLLATAAYNAGPNRALRWRTAQPIEGAIYAETIPFTETRDYVKKVFANTVFYARGFNQPDTSLKARLGTVAISTAAPCANITDSGACANIP